MYFDKYQEKFDGKPFRVRTRKNEMGENEVGEGNAFSGALANAKKDGKNSFEVDGKTYQVKESKRTNSVREKVIFTESELINFIERLVEAEKVVDKGFKTAMNSTKKENTDAIKQVASKMKDYMKNMGTEYEENPQSFPKGNKIMSREDFGKEVSDDKKNMYTKSDAVEEYIEAFSYPGQTNLLPDEIKFDDNKIEKYLEGHSTTGNAQVDEDGNALGNVVPSEVGKKFYKNYKDNLYGAEQMKASYKRQPQPIEIAGDEKSKGSLKSLTSAQKSQKIFDKLEESVENKKVISEMEKMKNLIGYNRKTQ
jgi:ribosomal protein L25 (general stress protein Ctc)